MEKLCDKDDWDILDCAYCYKLVNEKCYCLQAIADGELAVRMMYRAKYFEGKAEGEAEGWAEGKAKGEAKCKAEMVKKLIDRNCPVELIVEVSGYTVGEIERLRA